MTTDKSKPWLHSKHPEAIACKAAGKKLYSELSAANIQLNGVGVTTTDDNQNAAISVYLLFKEDLKKIPSSYGGFEVKATVVGRIKAF